jgi:hypothetical protein
MEIRQAVVQLERKILSSENWEAKSPVEVSKQMYANNLLLFSPIIFGIVETESLLMSAMSKGSVMAKINRKTVKNSIVEKYKLLEM